MLYAATNIVKVTTCICAFLKLQQHISNIPKGDLFFHYVVRDRYCLFSNTCTNSRSPVCEWTHAWTTVSCSSALSSLLPVAPKTVMYEPLQQYHKTQRSLKYLNIGFLHLKIRVAFTEWQSLSTHSTFNKRLNGSFCIVYITSDVSKLRTLGQLWPVRCLIMWVPTHSLITLTKLKVRRYS